MSRFDSGRIETILACAILAAVIGLFVKFYRPASERPATSDISAPEATN